MKDRNHLIYSFTSTSLVSILFHFLVQIIYATFAIILNIILSGMPI